MKTSASPHPAGSVNPGRDLEWMDAELALNDLIAVERKLERLAEEKKKGAGREKSLIDRENSLFEIFQRTLSGGTPLRDLEIEPAEEKLLSGFGLLTLKPMLVLLNLADGQTPPQLDYLHKKSAVLPLQGRLEMDLAQLAPDEAELFMAEYGIDELGLEKVIRQSYDLLGQQSFFTVGEDEVRAWTVSERINRLGGGWSNSHRSAKRFHPS